MITLWQLWNYTTISIFQQKFREINEIYSYHVSTKILWNQRNLLFSPQILCEINLHLKLLSRNIFHLRVKLLIFHTVHFLPIHLVLVWSSLYPSGQVQIKDPYEFSHIPGGGQALFSWHSLISSQFMPSKDNLYPSVHSHVNPPLRFLQRPFLQISYRTLHSSMSSHVFEGPNWNP